MATRRANAVDARNESSYALVADRRPAVWALRARLTSPQIVAQPGSAHADALPFDVAIVLVSRRRSAIQVAHIVARVRFDRVIEAGWGEGPRTFSASTCTHSPPGALPARLTKNDDERGRDLTARLPRLTRRTRRPVRTRAPGRPQHRRTLVGAIAAALVIAEFVRLAKGATAMRGVSCHSRDLGAAVVIEPVSADSLRKMGIFADRGGDFRRFAPQLGRTKSPETKPNARKAGIPALSRVSWEAGPKAGLCGWRRSTGRTRLRPNSLQTGNFSGNLVGFANFEAPNMAENAATAGLLC